VSKIIGFFNQSGGVGKTTLTMNVGYHLAKFGAKVLLVDMDPQGSLTVFMGLEPNDLEDSVYNAIAQEEDLPIFEDIHGMSLAPSNILLSRAEMELASAIMRELRLKNALSPLQSSFDFILVDCPPSLGLLSIMSLVASTHVLIPIQTEFKALKGTELLTRTISEIIRAANKQLKIAGIVPTMYDSRLIQGTQSLDSIKKLSQQIAPILSVIPRKTDFANASQEKLPLSLYSPQSPAVACLQEIAKKLENL